MSNQNILAFQESRFIKTARGCRASGSFQRGFVSLKIFIDEKCYNCYNIYRLKLFYLILGMEQSLHGKDFMAGPQL